MHGLVILSVDNHSCNFSHSIPSLPIPPQSLPSQSHPIPSFPKISRDNPIPFHPSLKLPLTIPSHPSLKLSDPIRAKNRLLQSHPIPSYMADLVSHPFPSNPGLVWMIWDGIGMDGSYNCASEPAVLHAVRRPQALNVQL